MIDKDPATVAALLNAHRGGFNEGLGLRFVRVSLEEVVATVELDARHTQPYGIVHGGVHASVVETVCSTGAALSVIDEGKSAVGLDNHTSFLKALRGGTVTVTARPVQRGRRTQVWRAEVRNEAGELAATGQVRMLILERGAMLAGVAADGQPRS